MNIRFILLFLGSALSYSAWGSSEHCSNNDALSFQEKSRIYKKYPILPAAQLRLISIWQKNPSIQWALAMLKQELLSLPEFTQNKRSDVDYTLDSLFHPAFPFFIKQNFQSIRDLIPPDNMPLQDLKGDHENSVELEALVNSLAPKVYSLFYVPSRLQGIINSTKDILKEKNIQRIRINPDNCIIEKEAEEGDELVGFFNRDYDNTKFIENPGTETISLLIGIMNKCLQEGFASPQQIGLHYKKIKDQFKSSCK